MLSLLAKMPDNCHPMDVVRTAISYLGAEDPEEDDSARGANLAKALRMIAVLPTIVAADMRRRRGLEPIAPHSHLGFAENFLNMCFGEVPEPEIVKAFEVSLVLYAEHSFNASTFAARVVTSTLSDIYSAVTAAIGALKGPLHGGANEAVMHDMIEIGEPDRGRRVAARQAGRQGKGHGLRSPGVQERRLAGADDEAGTRATSPRSPAARSGSRCTTILEKAMVERHRDQAEPRLPHRAGLLPDGLRHRVVHPDLRDEPDHRMDRAHHRAGRVQRADPPARASTRRRRSAPSWPDILPVGSKRGFAPNPRLRRVVTETDASEEREGFRRDTGAMIEAMKMEAAIMVPCAEW